MRGISSFWYDFFKRDKYGGLYNMEKFFRKNLRLFGTFIDFFLVFKN